MAARRIVSLIPGATEIVCALGLGDRLVGRSHECDAPAWVAGLPAVTRSVLPGGLEGQAEIDAAVGAASATGEPLYRVDDAALARLRPDLVITQALCDVCAVGPAEAGRAVAALPGSAEVLLLSPGTLDDALDDVLAVGRAAGVPEAAAELVAGLRSRLTAVAGAVAGRTRPRVACLEWLDPPYAAGHWVPDQVRAAGGVDALAEPGARSARIGAGEVAAACPEVVVLMPCGLDLAAARAAVPGSLLAALGGTPAARTGRVVAADANGLFSRPGPRLVDGVEALAAVLHPGVAPPAPGTAAAGAH